jgi:hypothetical protein
MSLSQFIRRFHSCLDVAAVAVDHRDGALGEDPGAAAGFCDGRELVAADDAGQERSELGLSHIILP